MQVQLETLSNLERRMNIALPMAAIDAQVTERLKRVARTAKIQGFRPGKAPLKIVEANYGAQVREEVLGEQVQQGFYSAVSEQKLRVAGYPRFEPVAAEGDVRTSSLLLLSRFIRKLRSVSWPAKKSRSRPPRLAMLKSTRPSIFCASNVPATTALNVLPPKVIV
jgi:hypothetical protein